MGFLIPTLFIDFLLLSWYNECAFQIVFFSSFDNSVCGKAYHPSVRMVGSFFMLGYKIGDTVEGLAITMLCLALSFSSS